MLRNSLSRDNGAIARQQGFTLLEMIVVMVLLGLVSSLTLPAMQRWHQALVARSDASAIVDVLQAAAFDAGVQKRRMRLDTQSFVSETQVTAAAAQTAGAMSPQVATASPVAPRSLLPITSRSVTVSPGIGRVPVTLPPGWTVNRVVPAVFGADGLCQPGLVALTSAQGTALIFSVLGPICKIEWALDHGTESKNARNL